MPELYIREFVEADWPNIWQAIEPVFRAGETYPVAPDITEEQARAYWLEKPAKTLVAVTAEGELAGTYYIVPNQPTLGAHVCNCGYIVAASMRGRGVATALCQHSQEEAQRLGFTAMQFNLVISTNEAAIAVWKRNGFDIIGTLPKAFNHLRFGKVDAHIMYKTLSDT